MKLNYKRTLLVGFAFFLICMFWNVYDTIIPLMLTNKFGLPQDASGFIMALDNILALFMLPLFGAISDKKNTRYGKRTPFIFIGTILAIVCFVGLSFADSAQLKKISQGSTEVFWEQNYQELKNKEYNSITNSSVQEKYSLRDYASKVYFGESYDNLSDVEKQELETWYTGVVAFEDVSYKGKAIAELTQGEKEQLFARMPEAEHTLGYNCSYAYDKEKDSYRLCYTTEEKGEKVTRYLDDGTVVPEKVRTANAYSALVMPAESVYANSVMKQNVAILVIFIIALLMTLISMATFRSPAVALMPDVTVKPLRSKANAIINLMGTLGGIIVMLLGKIFGTGNVENQLMNYTPYILTVCGLMAIALVVFIFTVKEKRWNQEMLDAQAILDQEESKQTADINQEQSAQKSEKLPKDKLISLIFILLSVAMWFTGYNAVTSKYSVYALNVLNKDYNTTLLIAQAAAVAAYIPVGMLASKIGRKRSIMIGVALLFSAFFGAIFIDASSPDILITLLFALAGIAWATINVNSFPMVVELAKGSTIGKYTGYYYTASMTAQVITPILSGVLMEKTGRMEILFPYATVFIAIAFVTMCFVKHGDSKPETPKDKMEMLAGADD